MKIAEYLGDELYSELDVTESDYETLPAYEFYGKVEKSCRELRPDIIQRIEAESVPGEPEPWKTFESGEDAKAFLTEYAKKHFYLCIDILEDIFYHDYDYKIHPTKTFYDLREIWWNRAKEVGKDTFLDKVKHGKDQALWGPYSLNSVRALARRIAPAKCVRYCWIRKIMVRQAGSYVIWDESKLNSPS